jgi:hypothetical protein
MATRTLDFVLMALKRPEALWTLASNAIPVIGVLFLGWAALPLMIFYWIENVFIGVFNLPKILIAGLTKPMPLNVRSLFLAPFFVFHYGLFCLVQGTFIFAIFTMSDLIAGHGEPTTQSFNGVDRVVPMVASDSDLRWSVIALFIVLAFRFIVLWLGRAEWRGTDPMRQMFEPYGRVVVLHVTILVCAIPLIALGQPVIGVLVLALFKTALELGLPQFQIGTPSNEKTA